MCAGRWVNREALPLAHKVSGKKLGILGMGRIGRAMARRAQGVDLRISRARFADRAVELRFECRIYLAASQIVH